MAGLLNIGEMGALALHVLVDLAVLKQDNPDARRTVQEIATALQASVHTLQKVTRRLIVMELAEGTRGVNGGLRLIADPKSVTMLQVLEGIEGRICSNGCMFAKTVCHPGKGCIFTALTGTVESQVRKYFADTTLADLCEMARQTTGNL